MPRSSDTTARPVSDGNLSTAGHHKMDITKLAKPLRLLSLAFAFVCAILPVFSLGIVAYHELTGINVPFGHRGLFVVSVLSGLSVFLLGCMYLFEKQGSPELLPQFLYMLYLEHILDTNITKVLYRVFSRHDDPTGIRWEPQHDRAPKNGYYKI